MYTNKVTLIGFLGNDAEVRSNDNRSFTIPALATKSSYKKDSNYIEHTEWHRCMVSGELGEFAGGLKRGAHLMVEGGLRSRKYDSTKLNAGVTTWEIRVDSIQGRSGSESEPRGAGERWVFRRGSGPISRFYSPPRKAGKRLPSLTLRFRRRTSTKAFAILSIQ
jgi:single-strand DNA-binding protein